MSRGILILLSVVAGLLAGCTTRSDPAPSGAVSANAPAAPEPAIMTPGAADPVAGPGIGTPSGTSTPDGTTMSQFTATPVAGLPQCDQYSVTATVDGKPQPLNGEACQQPDGSWHIAEQAAVGEVVYQTVYWPPAGAVAYNDVCFDGPYDYPCLYGFPFGFSVGFPVFIDIHRHFHHFISNGQFHSLRPMGHFGPVSHFSHVEGFHGEHEGDFHGGGFHHN
jgi:hypothetical protein